jgi:hypothetical protein
MQKDAAVHPNKIDNLSKYHVPNKQFLISFVQFGSRDSRLSHACWILPGEISIQSTP